ncbi:group 1 glycosyl transferase [Parafrankia colletiae]|uniref:Group 1 glycosyl transferase n=1 Tax=Parafrankia colletiae TaxID=573497 RepID=A0A1S1QB73_9ACTN|nr:glycosyltransferase family 4 protein [Parafrankia colletiae]MCK9900281.1 glycosyltransferase family 4 protein [Frankia sp. Cpl3]OHV30465.1 group 1 glycosyl transferase [Parafrankia colletiae]
MNPLTIPGGPAGGSAEAEPTVDVLLSRALDPYAWERRHTRGEVPDAWPYGLNRLADHGFRVTAAAPNVRHSALGARAARAVGGFEWLEVAARPVRRDAAAVMCWDERAGVPAALLARRRRQQAVATGVIWLTDAVGRPRGALAMAPSALRSAQLVWALSSAQIPVLRDVFGVPERQLGHLPFGVDADFFRPAIVEPVPGLVVSIGNDRHRDHETLLRAAAAAAAKVPDLCLELVSGRDVEVPAEFGVRRPRLAHPELVDLYGRSSVVVVALKPNLHVSGISVVLEAMSSGRPVIVSGTPGMDDYVNHGRTGLLVPPGDVDALATEMAGLLLDPDRSAALGRAGRAAVEALFNTDAQARRLADLLRAM